MDDQTALPGEAFWLSFFLLHAIFQEIYSESAESVLSSSHV